ncbi:3-hydroxyacyl-[acyl-carrier-protein] dehydratase FabZ [Posidoniimonas corsicana]|uniref:3-hydroxyacyl-[acyl-carrier-protein] dehydratase FabZ n=1 Tax=Posidoniimonas corsicana TaxID=1938618 RepID=A0A5C5UXX2_9BACT|nr:3-hydroxyacyl-ACP dehydratase FabZ family protein [Posidoniimonas corsicana]TWT30493.1 3-hydroxyacyl-[acyl-carrier-protein] dehydratase FabZ [Posidoniimonas corsicana]
MPTKDLIVDPATIDFDTISADLEAIRAYNPQRFEMEHLTAIVHDDAESGLVIAYKDTSDQEFWVRGHMPGMPLMPGVIMCEAAAQACSYLARSQGLVGERPLGFGGLDDVRFRGPVRPGDRLVIAAQRVKYRPGAMVVFRFQCFVGQTLVCEGQMRGVPLPVVD